MNSQQTTVSLESYDISRLMTQTRKLASDYRNNTGHALPVTEELARFDGINILGLRKKEGEEGIDAVSTGDTSYNYLIKGRVIFKGGKARQKLGKLSLQAGWNKLLMVIYDAEYFPSQVYSIDRSIIEQELDKLPQDKRGSMTVAKYKAIGEQVWSKDAIAKDMDSENKKEKAQKNAPSRTAQAKTNQTDI